MKIFSFTLCCLILRVRSQFNIRELNYPKYGYSSLVANPGQIYFEDQLARNPQTSDLTVRQVPSQNEHNGQAGQQQSSGVQQNSQQLSTPSVNPANFNLWNQQSTNLGQNAAQNTGVFNQVQRNQQQDVPLSTNQASLFPNQEAINLNKVNLNQNSLSNRNENVIRDIDLSILEDTVDKTTTNKKQVKKENISIAQELQKIFGLSANGGTLNSGKPKIDSIGAAVTHFGLNLLKTYDDTFNGNIVMSPFSISTCLALLQQGTRGSTQSQITNALQLSPEISRSVYKAMADHIKKRWSVNILRTTNNIFMAKNFDFRANFSNVAQDDFKSVISTLDYSLPEQAAEEINKWVAAQTNNKIKKLVSPNDIGITTQMTLVNAVYFKGLWNITFDEGKTKTHDFHLSNGQKKPVSFMRSRRTLKGGTEPATNARIIILPFKDEEYSLMCILPSKESNINELIKSLTAEQLLEFTDLPSQEFDVQIPKFTIRSDTNLVPALKNMGVSDMFGPFADLSGIGENRFHTFPLQVSSATHSAVLSINEAGGSAGAATSFGVVALSYDMPLKFKADRPFLVILWDRASAVPLFMAKVMEPIEQEL